MGVEHGWRSAPLFVLLALRSFTLTFSWSAGLRVGHDFHELTRNTLTNMRTPKKTERLLQTPYTIIWAVVI
jgi:hypothetical protein